jgi:hypothetical protein
MRIFTAWGGQGDKGPSTFIGGEGPPRAANGTLLSECEQFFWRIEAGSWEEASAVYHLRQGWEAYQPEGAAEPCPECGALHYPKGSGQCWRCDHHC